ncbi:MAG: TonB-dependent receptor [Candidatus Eisenbacteria sp.]|nr:TonB-dependent receptor [Candidatus Eisenbacteria bacterium]
MGTRLLKFILISTGILIPGSSSSQTIAFRDTVYHLSEVLVEADRLSEIEQLRNRPAFITILPMEETHRRVSSTAECLSQSVSFHVKSTGGYGAYSTASIRGSSSKQVSIFIDGIPLNQSHSGLVDLADLPVSSLSRIEVYRGFSAFDLSGSAIGGVVNLVTEGASSARGRLSMSHGSLSTQRYQASCSFSRSCWDVLAVGTALSTEGSFEFLDDNGTPYNKDDDEIAGRINNHLEEREVFMKASRALGPGTLVLADQFLHRKQGLPGYGTYQSRTEALSKTHNLLHISWDRPATHSLPLRLSVGLFSVYQMDHFMDRQEKKPPAKPDVRNQGVSYGANLRWQVPLPRLRQSLRGLVEVRQESFQPEETFTETIEGQRQSRRSLVLTLEDEIDAVPGRFRLVPGARYEKYVDCTRAVPRSSFLHLYVRDLADTTLSRESISGHISAVADLGYGIVLKANHGRYHRVPSLMELFGYRGFIYPSPQLKPETGRNSDLGVRWEHTSSAGRFVSIEYAHFWSRVENLIMWFRRGSAAGAVNIDSAEIEGYEFSLSCGDWMGFSFSGNLTGLDAVNTGPVSYAHGKRLPDRPELAAFGKVAWRRGRKAVFYEFDYIGGNYWNSYNGIPPNSKDPVRVRRLHGMGVTLPVGLPGMELTAEVKNITDEQVEDVMGFPMPGRSFYGTLIYDL